MVFVACVLALCAWIGFRTMRSDSLQAVRASGMLDLLVLSLISPAYLLIAFPILWFEQPLWTLIPSVAAMVQAVWILGCMLYYGHVYGMPWHSVPVRNWASTILLIITFVLQLLIFNVLFPLATGNSDKQFLVAAGFLMCLPSLLVWSLQQRWAGIAQSALESKGGL